VLSVTSASGSCAVTVTKAADSNYSAATSAAATVTLNAAAQAITGFAPASPVVFGSAAATLTASGGASGNPIVFATTSVNTICTVSGNLVTFTGTGVCNLTANQAASGNYGAAPQVVASITITAASQTITFSAPANQPLAGPPLVITATTTSGLPVTFASQTPAVCTTSGINGNMVTMVALGTCTIRASQAGDANYGAAVSVDRSFSVTTSATQLTLTSSASIAAFGAPLTLTVNVYGASPSGSADFIVFNAGAAVVPLCSGVPLVAGVARCNVPGEYQKVSPVRFQVTYGGDANNAAGSAVLMQLVSLSSSTLTVTAFPQRPVAGRSLTLNALVIQRGLNGAVSFYEYGVMLPGCSSVALSSVGGRVDAGVAACQINAVTAGNHTFVVNLPSPSGIGFEQLLVNVDVAASGPLDYTDMWWGGEAENGWGLSVNQHGDTQFALLFVYDDAGNPIWYAMPGGSWNGTTTVYSGALYRPTSSPYAAYDASMFSANAPVGSATITYTSESTATLSYTINGISDSKPIVREPYGGEDGQPTLLVKDMWWAGIQENGWGLSVDHHGKVLFPLLFTYDAAGKTTFYAVPGGAWNGTTFTGDVYHPTSSAWLGVRYNANAFRANKVGTMSFTFIDQVTATMTYTIDGVTRTSTIVRQPY
jgi:hypothetical protein